MGKSHVLTGAGALGLGLILLLPLAGAQQANEPVATPPPVAAPPAQQLERIEVTGSYIRRTDVETPSPVQVLDTAEIRRSGATSIADILTALTGNNQGTLSQGFSGAFAEGACGVALRGMTVGSTLVLLDGHRMAPYPLADDGQRSFVDICSLPLDAVDRVEVLKDGASATYGSDAIAGVVNVILKKSYKGATVSAENGWSQQGGGQTSHVTGTIGFGDLASDGWNSYVAVEYRHQDELSLAQRPNLGNLNYLSQGGQDLRPGAYNPTGPNWSGTPVSATGYFVNPNAAIGSPNPFSNFGYLPGCNATAQINDQCLVNTNWLYIEPPTQNLNVLARGTMKLGQSWEASVTASLFQSEVMLPLNAAIINGTQGGYSAAGLSPGPNHTTNAVLNNVPTFTAPVLASYHLNPANFTVGQQYPVNFMTNDLGGQDTYVKNDTYRLVAEAKGSAAGWDLDADWGWTSAVMDLTQTGFPIFSILQQDLYNGSYLPGQQNSASVDAAIAPAQYSKNVDELWFMGAHGSRDLFKLPGGNMGLAIGADFFFRSLQAVPANLSVTAQQATNFAYAEGSQSDWSAFMELSAPVLKQLEVDGAVRYDKYNTYSPGDFTPKIGFKFTPIEQIAARGTYSRGFRAPNPVESQSSGAGGYYFSAPDPVLCASGSPTAPNTYPNQCNIPYVYLTVANPALQPEKSISKTMGLILEPSKWINASVDWYDITLDNQIYPASEDSAFVPTPVRGAPQAQPYVNSSGVLQQGVTPPIGNLLYFTVPYININSTEVKGLDYELKNHFDIGVYGKVKSDFIVAHMLHYYFSQPGLTPAVYDLAGTHGPNEISGDTGTPRNRARWNITWEKGGVEAQLAMNYISGFDVIDPSAGQFTCAESLNAAANYGGPFYPYAVPPGACHVASFTDFDFYSGWQADNHWNVHFSIDNLFGRGPPADMQTYAAPGYNPSLHMAGAVGRFYNIGARYVF